MSYWRGRGHRARITARVHAATSIRAQFVQDGEEAGAVVRLFDAIVGLLMGNNDRH